MKRVCPTCGMVQTNLNCTKCNEKTVSKGRRIVQKGSSVGPKEGRSNG